MSYLKTRIVGFLEKPKIIKFSALGTIIVFLPGVLVAVLVSFYSTDGGFNIIDNYISNLGSSKHTPSPYIFNIICMISAVLLLPAVVNMNKVINKDVKTGMGKMGYISMLLGLFGQFMIGIFNETMQVPHILFAAFAFGGFILGGLIYGVIIVRNETIIPKSIGIYMIVAPFIIGLFTGLSLPPSQPFWEWFILFSLITWQIIICLYLIIEINKGLES